MRIEKDVKVFTGNMDKLIADANRERKALKITEREKAIGEKIKTFDKDVAKQVAEWHKAFAKLGITDETIAKVCSCALVMAMGWFAGRYNPMI